MTESTKGDEDRAGGIEPTESVLTAWASKRHWAPTDGVLLAFGIDPSAAKSSDSVSGVKDQDAVVHEALEAARESVERGLLRSDSPPAEIIRWAEHRKLRFHSAWLTRLYRQGKTQAERALTDADRALAERAKDIKQREALIRDWAKAPYWSLEEGVALMYNLDPMTAVDPSVTGYDDPCLKGNDRAALHLRHARTAALNGDIDTTMKPHEFLDWAPEIGIPVDPAWHEAVPRPIPERSEESLGDLRPRASSGGPDIRDRDFTSIDLEYDKRLASALDANVRQKKELQPKERDSLLKLVIGMAIVGYKFDPKRERNDATTEIASDLDELGIGLDRGTILKWLREGAELIPPEALDD